MCDRGPGGGPDGLPLEAGGETIGLLALYLPGDRIPGESEQILLEALSSQLAVAVHHARLHEHTTGLGADLEHSLRGEQQAVAQLKALSRSRARSPEPVSANDAGGRREDDRELVGVDVGSHARRAPRV